MSWMTSRLSPSNYALIMKSLKAVTAGLADGDCDKLYIKKC